MNTLINVLSPCEIPLLNVPGPCDLTPQCIRTPQKCQDPKDHKTHTSSPKTIRIANKYPHPIDNDPQVSYSIHIHIRRALMSVAYHQAQKVRYRVTLDLEVFSDFDPHQMDWEKLFKLEPAEKCSAYVEDLSTPDRW